MTRMTMPVLGAAMLLGALAPIHAVAANPTHGISEAQARKEITLDGYQDVRDLHKVTNGWVASAKESGKSVSVLADNHGDVMKQ